jgi:outer membrane protein
MFRKLIYSSLFSLLALATISAQSVGIVDVTNILDNMDEYLDAQDKLDKLAADWNQEIAKEYDKIKSMYNKYQAEQVLLTDELRTRRENDITSREAQVRELQRAKFGPEGELFLRRQQLVSPIQEKVFNEIESYANEKGIDIMLDKSSSAGILFASEEYDKTSIIKKRLGIR